MSDDKLTKFDYLLNALEHAAQSDKPAQNGYGEKRRALLAHVRELERDAARYRWLRDNPWPPELQADIALHRNARWDDEIDAAMCSVAGWH